MNEPIDLPALGPRRPHPGPPDRARPSVRRTTTISCAPEAADDGERLLVVDARGRDLVTNLDGTTLVADTASLQLVLSGALRTIVALEALPSTPELDRLVGCAVMVGFRKALAALDPPSAPAGSLLHLLLDDLPGAALVAGYGELASGALQRTPEVVEASRSRLPLQRDLCAGWAAEGGMMQTAEATGWTPTPPSVAAPAVTRSDDPDAWHEDGPLPIHATRRRRRLDVRPGDGEGVRYDVHFRDTYAEAADTEGAFHEYSLWGEVRDGRLASVEAAAHVLPWQECPSALGSERRATGLLLTEVRDLVRHELRGTSTCTHLNDSLRSMADLGDLAALLPLG